MAEYGRQHRLRAAVPLLALLVGGGLSWLLWHGARPSSDEAMKMATSPSPRSVIFFAPNLTESAWALGYGDQVAGVTDFCVWPPELLDRPRVGGMVDPNLERILALHPDLLVVQGESQVLRRFAQRERIRLASVKMDDDLASIFEGISRVDSLMSAGQDPRAPALLHHMHLDLSAVAASVEGLDRPSVLLVLGHAPNSLDQLFTMGGSSFLSELVETAGGRPQYADRRSGYFTLGLESLVANPPDVAIEVIGYGMRTPTAEEATRPWKQLGLERVRVEVLDFDGTMIPGPRIAETARRLRSIIHPDLPAAGADAMQSNGEHRGNRS